jgi:hypothetical protein
VLAPGTNRAAPIHCSEGSVRALRPSILSTNSQTGILMSANQVIYGTSAEFGHYWCLADVADCVLQVSPRICRPLVSGSKIG